SAHQDLLATLEGRPDAAGALLFTCNGRGLGFFGEQDHDAKMVGRALTSTLAGAFCAGEIGPVGGGSHVHGFTASLAVFRNATETLEQRPGNGGT
ncbi:MAG: FIST C-terminal domain-containing protein, partial [Actinobacteria bacterium]|nr:FIST C-terminal domain-containing protein [Actinomycetota bacterium]